MCCFFPSLLILLNLLVSGCLRISTNGANRVERFSANVHQTLLIELVSAPRAEEQQQHEGGGVLGKRGAGGEERQVNRRQANGRKKNRKDRVARHQQKSIIVRRRDDKCERLDEHQKYGKLEKVGGRNQLFMAASPREAGRNFPTLMTPPANPNKKQQPEEDPNLLMTLMDIPFMDDEDPTIGTATGLSAPPPPPVVEECGDRCREIERKLKDAVREQRRSWQENGADGNFRLDDEGEEEAAEEEEEENVPSWPGGGGIQRVRRSGCYLERFVPIGNCTQHGFEEALGDEKLCTSCQGIFVLNRECFPVFVNSVICDHKESECIYDRLSGSAQGKCRPKVLSFKVMRNRGTADCEQWAYEYIAVPVACECYLSKRSVWLEAVPPPIGEEHLVR